MIKTIVFDVDGTLIDTQHAILHSLKDTVKELQGKTISISALEWVIGVPSETILAKMEFPDLKRAQCVWRSNMSKYSRQIQPYAGITAALKTLKKQGYQLGIITSKMRKEFAADFSPLGLDSYFDPIVCVDDCKAPKPSPEPMYTFMEKSGAKKEEILYIGDTEFDEQCAVQAGVRFGLAVWGVSSLQDRKADFYFNHPKEISYRLSIPTPAKREQNWINLAMELQFLAQGGLAYSKDAFDIERFKRIREISAEMISHGSGYSKDYVKDLFCNETGFQTPKLDTRAAIFKEDKILLVQEKNGTWSLPGGWVDVNESIKSNTVKEVQEEAGLEVVATRLIALQDRNRHNPPRYAYGIIKAFVLCEVISGSFTKNTETLTSAYFTLKNLPNLAEEKVTVAQIEMCFKAYNDKNWTPLMD